MSYFCVIVLCTIAIVIAIWLMIKKKFQYWNEQNVLNVPGSFPLGNLGRSSYDQHVLLKFKNSYDLFKEKDVICGFYTMMTPVIIPLDLDLIKNILIKDFNNFHDRGLYVNEKDDPLSAHLFSLPGSKWRSMRSKISPTFTSGRMKEMFPIIVHHGEKLVNCIDSELEKPIEAKNLGIRFTADVIGECAFGIQCNALKDEKNKVFQIAKKTADFSFFKIFKILFENSFQSLSLKLGLKQNSTEVINFFIGVTKDAVNYRKANNVERRDFLNNLITLKNEDDVALTLNEMAAQSFVFFFAGFDTSSTTITWCLYELGINQVLQHKVRNEINLVSNKYDGKLTYESVQEMIFLEMCINETLRKYTPIPMLIRVADEDYHISNSKHIVKKGTQVFISTYGIHNDERYYPNPNVFNPERFSEENLKARHPFAFLPFGEGPRNCIGNRFGMMLTKMGLISFLKNFSFTINDKTADPMEFDATNSSLVAKGGIWLDIKKL